MSELRRALDEYLAVRRSVGYKLVLAGFMLRGFVAELEALGQEKVTTAAALAWATKPAQARPAWWAQRLQMVRSFATFLHALDPAHEVPPAWLLTAKAPRLVRHAFTEAEVVALMDAAGELKPELRGATHATLIGLLATTGMRVGEAIGLASSDVDLDAGVLAIRHAKLDRQREIPLHETTVATLGSYALRRDHLLGGAAATRFFVGASGTALTYAAVHETFIGLLSSVGFESRPRLRPRIHDLRHRFAVMTVADWYEQGVDAEARLATLATYLGHVDPSRTYWYLRTTPELMQAAAGRLEVHLGELP